jgi:hypothetical protein
LGAVALSRVPASAGHGAVVAPDDLAGREVLDVAAVAAGVEALAAVGDGQAQ